MAGLSLGMVIEGGRDTMQKVCDDDYDDDDDDNDDDNDPQEPRIINIQPGGQAFETAGLRVGQVIQRVNDIQLKGWRQILNSVSYFFDSMNKMNELCLKV